MNLHPLGDDRETTWEAIRAQAVHTLLPADRVFVIGDDEDTDRLVRCAPDRFVPLGPDAAPGSTDTVLLLGLRHLKEGVLLESAPTTWLLVPTSELAGLEDGSSAVARVRVAVTEQGAVALDVHRLFRRDTSVPGAGLGRLAKLDAETPELLARVRPRTEEAVAPLEDHLRMVERELEILAEQQVEHARTREAERLRAERLQVAERRLRDIARDESAVDPSSTSSPVVPTYVATHGAMTVLRRVVSRLRRMLSRP